MNTKPTVSVVIPVRGGSEIIARCVSDILSSEFKPLEIIVVTDNNSNETTSIAGAAGATTISNPDSRGVSSARNAGANASSGDIIIFADADITFMPDTIGAIVDSLADDNVVGAIGLYSEEPSFRNFCSDFKNLWVRHTYDRMPDDVSLFFTSIAAIKRAAFDSTGGFDENYKTPSIEDTAFGRVLADLGLKVKLCRKAHVVHHKHYTLKSLVNTNFERASALVRLSLREKFTPRKNASNHNHALKKRFPVPTLYPLGAFSLCASLAVLICGIFVSALSSTMRWFTDLYLAIITFHHILRRFLEPPIRFSIDDIAVSAAISAALLFFALLSNTGFLFHAAKKRGILFAIKATLFWVLDCFVVTAGAINGVVGFIFCKRY